MTSLILLNRRLPVYSIDTRTTKALTVTSDRFTSTESAGFNQTRSLFSTRVSGSPKHLEADETPVGGQVSFLGRASVRPVYFYFSSLVLALSRPAQDFPSYLASTH